MDNAIDRRRTALYSVQPACACASIPTDWYLQVEKQSTTHVQPGSFRVSETGVPCTKDFFFAQVLCQFLKYMRDSTSNMCGERVHPCFQEQSYCRHQGDN